MIGPAGAEGEESFDIVVCTPDWLKQKQPPNDIIQGRHHLIVFRYDYEHLVRYITQFASNCTGSTCREVAEQLSRFGKWEFEDYKTTFAKPV